MSIRPIKFKPILKPVIWGGSRIATLKNLPPADGIGESWEISSVAGNLSVVAGGEFDGLTIVELLERRGAEIMGAQNYAKYGNNFPLLIKFIDARRDLSIQVHPDDELAGRMYGTSGKTEMWYVVDAQPESSIILGFSRQTSADEFLERIRNRKITEVLRYCAARKGMSFFLPAGRVHAVGAGCLIAEIQQSSDITYRIYDYDRPDRCGNLRELHVEQALEAINFEDYREDSTCDGHLARCDYFTVDLICNGSGGETVRDYSLLDSFVVYICTEGACKICVDGFYETLTAGESLLVAATAKEVRIEGASTLLECYI